MSGFDNWRLEGYSDLRKTKVAADCLEPYVKEFHDPLRVTGLIKGRRVRLEKHGARMGAVKHDIGVSQFQCFTVYFSIQ